MLDKPEILMSGDKRALLKEWLASEKARLQPLTFPQRELWEASPVAVTDISNHICCLIQMRGFITRDACEAAIRRVVERQEVMRLSFLPGKDRPIQMIRQASEANFRFRELASTRTHEEAVEDLANEIFSEPFDLVQGPLYRAEVLRRAADDHILVLAIHHANADGWTLGVFVQDLCVAYVQGLMGLYEALPPLPLTYSAWGAAQRAFWSRRNWSDAPLFGNPISPEAGGSGTRRRALRPNRVCPINGCRIFRSIWPMPRARWLASMERRSSQRCWLRFKSRSPGGQASRTSWWVLR